MMSLAAKDLGTARQPAKAFLPPGVLTLFPDLWRELRLVHSEQAEAYSAGQATPWMEKKSDRKEGEKLAGFVVSGLQNQ
jgi:hypothetical protein